MTYSLPTYYHKVLLILLFFGSGLGLQAKGKNNQTISHKIIVGYNFGATMPNYLSREIRAINSYWPQFTPHIGYSISYRLKPGLWLESGIMSDYKGMGVQDEVKYMYTDVDMKGDRIRGYFTGKNETTIKISYTTIPLTLAYQIHPRNKLRVGGYASYRSSSEFTGTVWDGYLRETDNKDILNSTLIEIPEKDVATFNFGNELRNFDFGLCLGYEYQLNTKFGLYTNLTYGLTTLFPSSFTGIDLRMHNLYLAVGISYLL